MSNKLLSARIGHSEDGSGNTCCAVLVPSNSGECVIFGEANTPTGFELNLNSGGKFYWNHDDQTEGDYVIESTKVPCHINDMVNQRISSLSKQESDAGQILQIVNSNTEASGSALSVFNVNSTNSASSSGSTGSTTLNKLDFENDCLDYEILWEDLAIAEQIGQGRILRTEAFFVGVNIFSNSVLALVSIDCCLCYWKYNF